MANVSRLFYASTADSSFLDNLHADDSVLRLAKNKIRDHLRKQFALASAATFGKIVQPRFFTQGSHAYRTLNNPAWTPPQQKDLDDGCYLPLSFVKGAKPSQAASMFFEFVDTALEGLATLEGWQFVKKPTCARVVIAKDAHIDIPLYAIPDVEFHQLQERVAKHMTLDQANARRDVWEELPSDSVLLAHRDEDWVVSDPRKIYAWFMAAVDIYDERLRRVCRYLKAWRDHHRPDLDKVSSILLMACVWKSFEDERRAFLPDREDELLLVAVRMLPTLLNGPVTIPACPAEDLNRLSPSDRKVAIDKATELQRAIEKTISNCKVPSEAVTLMREMFGTRIPDRPDMVSVVNIAAVTILSHPRKEVPAPLVGRSQSG